MVAEHPTRGGPLPFVTEEIVDWYDGVALGVMRSSTSEQRYFCFLLSWDMPNDVRVYGFVPCDDNWHRELLTLLGSDEDNWQRIVAHIDRLAVAASGIVTVVSCERLENTVLGFVEVDAEAFRQHLPSRVWDQPDNDDRVWTEGAIEPSLVRYWSRVVSQPGS